MYAMLHSSFWLWYRKYAYCRHYQPISPVNDLSVNFLSKLSSNIPHPLLKGFNSTPLHLNTYPSSHSPPNNTINVHITSQHVWLVYFSPPPIIKAIFYKKSAKSNMHLMYLPTSASSVRFYDKTTDVSWVFFILQPN